MFLLLALIVQIVQVVHGGRDCRLEKYNADFGQDFYNLTNVDSLSQCQDTCESDRQCFGFTWVNNNNRNCALYNVNGMRDGVLKQGQDSYKCQCGTERPKKTLCRASGGRETRWTSSIAGTQGINSRGGIGVLSYSCNSRSACMAKDGSNKCCYGTRHPRFGCRHVWSCS